jgi:aminopeptidase YwaD
VSRYNIFLWFVLAATAADAQKLKKEDKQLVANLQQHVQFLSSDQLQGRRTGTVGEKLAADYISKQFKTQGLQPKGTTDYLQPFDIAEGKQVNPATHLFINGSELKLNSEFFPLVYSANASVEAMPSAAIQESDMPWFLDLKELLEQNTTNPHFDVDEAVRKKAEDMQGRGATAVLVYNSSATKDDLAFKGRDRSETLKIPVVYISKAAATKYLADESATLEVKLKIDIGPKHRSGSNVVGYIDNGAPNTVVLGAHFDHLGLGEDGNSLARGDGKQVHNGADDNASGTSALIELSRLLKDARYKASNYLFIAFSAEELGLYGSKYYVEHPTIELDKVSYMINMDMLGRLNNAEPTITVGGYGTSPAWGEAYAVTGKKGLYTANLKFRYDSSGTGPSDHTSFYRKNIPVLFYFTGLHADYHKPTDDADKLNYVGQMNIVKHILSLIEATNKRSEKLAFTKTRETQVGTSARFSVTLGIMPDYSFSGSGVRVDGVSENRPAQKAGMKAGDVITALGENKVSSVEGYMQVLSKFKKGDKTTVTYNRGSETLSATIEF